MTETVAEKRGSTGGRVQDLITAVTGIPAYPGLCSGPTCTEVLPERQKGGNLNEEITSDQ